MKIIVGERPHKPLSVLTRPFRNELLSSWLSRCAEIYGCGISDLLGQLGISADTGQRRNDVSHRLSRLIDFRTNTIVQQRLAWGLHSTGNAISARCHPVKSARLDETSFVRLGSKPQACLTCNTRFKRRGLDHIQIRSWLEPWQLQCGCCALPRHLDPHPEEKMPRKPRNTSVPASLWYDAMEGSSIIERWLSGEPCGLLPPSLVVKILAHPHMDRGNRGPKRRLLSVIVPLATSNPYSPATMRCDMAHLEPLPRIAILAALARFNQNPRRWITRLLAETSASGRANITDIIFALPDVITDHLMSRICSSTEVRSINVGAQSVAAHQIRLKLADNLRRINESRLNLELYAAQHGLESHR